MRLLNREKKYDGAIGSFTYDPGMFKLIGGKQLARLVYTGKETDGSKITIPEGVKDCSRMFQNTKIVTPPVIPEGVMNCESMFEHCLNLEKPPVIPEGVVNCDRMFAGSMIQEKAVFPDSVQTARNAFKSCPMIPKEERGEVEEEIEIPLEDVDAILMSNPELKKMKREERKIGRQKEEEHLEEEEEKQ